MDKKQETYTPMSAEERQAQLERIADKLLYRIERGQCSASEREKLIRSYDAIDRILQRHYTGIGTDDDPLLELFRRWDEAALADDEGGVVNG